MQCESQWGTMLFWTSTFIIRTKIKLFFKTTSFPIDFHIAWTKNTKKKGWHSQTWRWVNDDWTLIFGSNLTLRWMTISIARNYRGDWVQLWPPVILSARSKLDLYADWHAVMISFFFSIGNICSQILIEGWPSIVRLTVFWLFLVLTCPCLTCAKAL